MAARDQGGKKRRGLPAAMRNLVDKPLAFGGSRAGGSCWFSSTSRR